MRGAKEARFRHWIGRAIQSSNICDGQVPTKQVNIRTQILWVKRSGNQRRAVLNHILQCHLCTRFVVWFANPCCERSFESDGVISRARISKKKKKSKSKRKKQKKTEEGEEKEEENGGGVGL